jgi:hypothetical protein
MILQENIRMKVELVVDIILSKKPVVTIYELEASITGHMDGFIFQAILEALKRLGYVETTLTDEYKDALLVLDELASDTCECVEHVAYHLANWLTYRRYPNKRGR